MKCQLTILHHHIFSPSLWCKTKIKLHLLKRQPENALHSTFIFFILLSLKLDIHILFLTIKAQENLKFTYAKSTMLIERQTLDLFAIIIPVISCVIRAGRNCSLCLCILALIVSASSLSWASNRNFSFLVERKLDRIDLLWNNNDDSSFLSNFYFLQ